MSVYQPHQNGWKNSIHQVYLNSAMKRRQQNLPCGTSIDWDISTLKTRLFSQHQAELPETVEHCSERVSCVIGETGWVFGQMLVIGYCCYRCPGLPQLSCSAGSLVPEIGKCQRQNALKYTASSTQVHSLFPSFS